jgi:hypothetical protein
MQSWAPSDLGEQKDMATRFFRLEQPSRTVGLCSQAFNALRAPAFERAGIGRNLAQ